MEKKATEGKVWVNWEEKDEEKVNQVVDDKRFLTQGDFDRLCLLQESEGFAGCQALEGKQVDLVLHVWRKVSHHQ